MSEEFALIFGDAESIERARRKGQKPPKIDRMHATYGHGPDGKTCGECVHCYGRQYAKTYYKCRHFGVTGGPGTDWSRKWIACGKFEQAGS